jgi:alpha-N-arabinofuranosidase
MLRTLIVLLSIACLSIVIHAQGTWKIDATQPIAKVSPDLFGIFFEEINHAGVGGLYSEQINNANFETLIEDYAPWAQFPSPSGVNVLLGLSQEEPLNAYNPTSFRIATTASNGASGLIGVYNPGFWGINLIGQSTFDVSFWAQSQTITSVNVSFMSNNLQTVYAMNTVKISNGWAKVQTTLTVSNVNDDAAVFAVTFNTATAKDAIYFDVFSVMPQQGWKGLPFIRSDLGAMVEAMKPSFVRFPGGCYVEGDRLSDRFNWKRSVGPIENRHGHWDLWGYYSEDGLGMFEYLSWVEQLRDAYGNPTRVIWVINTGVAHSDSIPTVDLGQWMQDALDSIEFAIGDTSTKWGGLRASMGHPAPFRLDYLAIGNEDCGKPYYLENYRAMFATLKGAYPQITFIANCDLTGQADTEMYDYHVYQNSGWFQNNQHTFDSANRTGAKIFNSEYAVTSDYGTSGNVNAALGEAAWMCGLERNSDIVVAASYAPLFVNWNNRQWMPDSIPFNSSQAYGTVSYHNQVLFANSFSNYKSGTVQTISNSLSGVQNFAVSATSGQSASSTNEVYVLKMVNYGNTQVNLDININSNQNIGSSGELVVLKSQTGSPNDENSFENPEFIVPTTSNVNTASTFTLQVPAYSISVLTISTAAVVSQ